MAKQKQKLAQYQSKVKSEAEKIQVCMIKRCCVPECVAAFNVVEACVLTLLISVAYVGAEEPGDRSEFPILALLESCRHCSHLTLLSVGHLFGSHQVTSLP